MKRLFAVLLWLAPAGAEPIVSGQWSLQAEPLDDQRARLEACWRQASGSEDGGDYWRAALDDQKVMLGTHQEVGPLAADCTLEEDWQDELATRRANLSLSLPDFYGWGTGVSGQWELTPVSPADAWQQAQWSGWLATPEWHGVSARAEIACTPANKRWLGRVGRKIGRGQLQLEAEQEQQAEHWQRRWLARYQWELAHGTRLSAQGGRRWSELEGDWQDQVEAQLEVHF